VQAGAPATSRLTCFWRCSAPPASLWQSSHWYSSMAYTGDTYGWLSSLRAAYSSPSAASHFCMQEHPKNSINTSPCFTAS
jgi:hypothetical protein